MDCLEVLKKDFAESLEKINFAKTYDPMSPRFLKTLGIGLMHLAVASVMADDVDEEMSGAEKYLGLYKKTGDGQYKDMAADELRHAGILIKKHLAEATDVEMRDKLNQQEKARQKMVSAVSTATVREEQAGNK